MAITFSEFQAGFTLSCIIPAFLEFISSEKHLAHCLNRQWFNYLECKRKWWNETETEREEEINALEQRVRAEQNLGENLILSCHANNEGPAKPQKG